MKNEILQTTKTILLAVIIGVGVQMASAAWSTAPENPPSGNVGAPINVGTTFQSKSGAFHVNAGSSQTPGFSSWQGISTISTVPGNTHFITDERGDTADTHYSGYELQENATFKGGLRKEGASNDIQIWRASAPAITVLQGNGFVGVGTQAPGAELEINGQIKITGGNPGAGKVLMSDGNGLATWVSLPMDDVYTYVDRIFYSYDDDMRFGTHYEALDTCDQNTNGKYICPNGVQRTCRDYVYADQANNDYYVHRYDVTCNI